MVRACLNACSSACTALLEGGSSFRGGTLLGKLSHVGPDLVLPWPRPASYPLCASYLGGRVSSHLTALSPCLPSCNGLYLLEPQTQINLSCLKVVLFCFVLPSI